MKRGSGFVALLAVLLTGAHFVGTRTLRPFPAAVTQAGPAIGTSYQDSSTCEAFADRSSAEGTGRPDNNPAEKGEITALVERYLYGTNEQPPSTPGKLPAEMKLMIALVPDPVHTHLSLQFDRSLEAIQQAAQDERYTYDSSWLPWQSSAGSIYSSLADQATAATDAARRELCPGIILFRRNTTGPMTPECRNADHGGSSAVDPVYGCGLLVFLVGEKPTSGLNKSQWQNALWWMSRHASPNRQDRALRLLGPTFSGSMPSIVRALKGLGGGDTTFTSVLLYSGHIRGCGSWRWLQSALSSSGNAPPSLLVRLSDFEENDAIQVDRFYRYLEDRGHRLSEVAVLSEDETAYGGLPDARLSSPPGDQKQPATAGPARSIESPPPCEPQYPANDRPVHLYYPRDISAISSAYQEQSIFSTDNSGTESHVVLRPEPDASAHRNTDTIEPFSGPNLALTQEAQMYGIVNTLTTHGIRYIVLRSTNSLDYLFLTRFLHRAYPAAYIVTMGTDLLFGREIDSTEFRGVIAISSFPLLPRGQDWTRQTDRVRQHAHRVFGSYTMEGDYVATRFLITDPPVARGEPAGNAYQHPPKPDIPDFSPPFWLNHASDAERNGGGALESVTWLAVIGRDGYWPLAVLMQPSVYSNVPRYSNLTKVARPEVDRKTDPVPNLFSLPGSWKFFCAATILLLGVHFFACRSGWRHQDLGMFIQFAPLPGQRGRMLMAVGWAAVCSQLILQFMAAACLWEWLTGFDRFWVVLSGAAAVAGGGLAFITMQFSVAQDAEGNMGKVELQKSEGRKHKRTLNPWIVFTFALVLLFIVASFFIFGYGNFQHDGVTVAYRAVHLTSGVSPLISILIMLAGFYWWFWHSLAGLALLGNGRPLLPRREQMPTGLARVSNHMAAEIEIAAMPLPAPNTRSRRLYLFPLLLVVGGAIVLQGPWSEPLDLLLHSLENAAYNWTLHFFLGITLFLLFLECAQLLMTWLALKRFLVALDRLPLRRTFVALQGLSMRSLWSLSGTSSRARYQIFSHQMEALLHLKNEFDDAEFPDCNGLAFREAIDTAWKQAMAFVEKRCEGLDLAMVNDTDAQAVRRSFAHCAEAVFREILVPQWLRERPESEQTRGTEQADGEPRTPLSHSVAMRVAEEFVCLIYVGYLQNLLARMRTMVLSIGGLFAAIALSVAFYPYTPRPTISLALTLVFLAIGALVTAVYAGLDRDTTLSRITNTQPGALGINFWVRIASFAGVPLGTLLVAQFPGITEFVTSWIRPSMDAMK